MKRWLWFSIIGLIALFVVSVGIAPAKAQSPITATVAAENAFPEGMIFRLDASSSAGDITDARLTFQLVGGKTRQSAPFEFEPGSSIESELHFDRRGDTPPAALVEYQVRVRDSAGNEHTTEPQQITYYPPEYDWKEITEGDATFVWYEGSQEWAQEMVNMAAPSVERAANMFGVDVKAPVRIVAFPDRESFHDAMRDLDPWVGGVTPQGTGMTIQIMSPDSGRQAWNEKVIPHEIAHVVWFLATSSALAPAPEWLVEGVALLNEPDNAEERAQVEQAAREGKLSRLSELRSNTSGTHDTAGLAYAQYWSLTNFMVEDCGDDALRRLVAELNAGRTFDDAMVAACGYNEQTLYDNWYASLTGSAPRDAAPVQPQAEPQPRSPESPAQPVPPARSNLPVWLGPALIVGGLGLFVLAVVFLVGITVALRRA